MALPPSSHADQPAMATILPPANRRRRLVWASVVLVVLLVVSAGGTAVAARFDARHHAEFLPGVTVDGVEIGGMDFDEAYRLLTPAVEDPLDQPITVTAADREFTVTPRELGASTNLQATLEEAAAFHRTMPSWARVWHRMTGRSAGAAFSTASALDGEASIAAFVEKIAAAVDAPPREATPQLLPGDVLQYTEASPGRTLDRDRAARAIVAAVEDGEDDAEIEVDTIFPAVPGALSQDVLVVKLGENKLLHFRNNELVRTYEVATGSRRYATPRGTFKIVNKRFRPTWVNPAKYPGGWGAGLPAKIGPGPGNPLGTRALDLNVGGIRIHGTSNGASIGYNVSHGCIRMHMSEVEELFGLVGVGTPVVILQTGPYRSQPAPSTPTIEDLAEADGTQIPGVAPAPAPVPPPVPVPAPAAPAVPPGAGSAGTPDAGPDAPAPAAPADPAAPPTAPGMPTTPTTPVQPPAQPQSPAPSPVP
jgi:lipoprotein-anchoring transpeptidase ErfK/SrfK